MPTKTIRISILDDHPGIIDGYRYRLEREPDIEIVGTAGYGEELEPLLAAKSADVLLLDVQVPTSAENANPYPILHLLPRLLQRHPEMCVLIISMHAQRALIQASMEAGASGYVLKDDQAAIRDLAAVVRIVAGGGVYMSQLANQLLRKRATDELNQALSQRQVEVLSLCAAYPDASTAELADKMNIAASTLRNLLSGAYLKLDVRSRGAAVARARQLGLLPQDVPDR